MSLSVENVYQSESSVRRELGELRHDQLPIFISALLLLTWAWLMVVTLGGKAPGIEDLPLAVAFFAGCAALFLREDSYTLASWVVLLGLMTLDSLVVLTYPCAVSLSLGVVVVVVGTVLWAPGKGLWLAPRCGPSGLPPGTWQRASMRSIRIWSRCYFYTTLSEVRFGWRRAHRACLYSGP